MGRPRWVRPGCGQRGCRGQGRTDCASVDDRAQRIGAGPSRPALGSIRASPAGLGRPTRSTAPRARGMQRRDHRLSGGTRGGRSSSRRWRECPGGRRRGSFSGPERLAALGRSKRGARHGARSVRGAGAGRRAGRSRRCPGVAGRSRGGGFRPRSSLRGRRGGHSRRRRREARRRGASRARQRGGQRRRRGGDRVWKGNGTDGAKPRAGGLARAGAVEGPGASRRSGCGSTAGRVARLHGPRRRRLAGRGRSVDAAPRRRGGHTGR